MLFLSVLAVVTPISLAGMVYLLGGWLMAVGLMVAPWRPKHSLGLGLSGLVVMAMVAGSRLYLAQSNPARLQVLVLPAAKETRWINWLIDEADSVLFGEAAMHLIGGVSAREHNQIGPAMSAAYQAALSAEGAFASPVVSTYLFLQRPEAFDAVVVEPQPGTTAPLGVIFLHGWTGNVTLQCLQIARAVEPLGAVTVCPSTLWTGAWWRPEGEATIRATFNYLRARGIERIYLGGFSNGGSGVGRLSAALADEPGLSGLFFIAGVTDSAEVRATGLPVLVIQGDADERMLVGKARRFAEEVGERATYVELQADHFLIMKQPEAVQTALSRWLAGHAP